MPLDNFGNYIAILPDPPASPPPFSGGGDNDVIGTVPDPNVASLVPADPTKPAFYYQDSGQIAFWAWSVQNQNWIPFISQ